MVKYQLRNLGIKSVDKQAKPRERDLKYRKVEARKSLDKR